MAFKPSGIKGSIVGRVVAAPEDKFDGKITELRIAVDHGYKDKQSGEWKETGTTWLTYTASGEYGKALYEFQKGDLIEVSDAAIDTRTYTKRDGGEGLQITARFGTLELLERKQLQDAGF